MIKEVFKSSTNKYGKYFLSMEAPGDDELQPVKSNTKVIDVKPNNRRRIDFTDGAEEFEEEVPEEPSEEVQDETNDSELDYNDDIDFNQEEDVPDDTETDGENNTDEVPTETEPTVTDDTETEINTDDAVDVDSPDVDTGEDFTQDENIQTDAETSDQSNVDSPDVDTGEDFTQDDGTGEVPPEGDANTENPPDAKKGPGLEYDSTRKYILFENYISLTNAINNYITKLENNMGENQNENQVIKIATEKFREIHDLCKDYMLLKFEISSYIQSLLFFQNLVVMVQMVFDLLGKTKRNIKNNNK